MWTDPSSWVTARFFFCFFCCFFLWSCPDLRLCSLVLDCVTVFWVDIEDQRGLWKGVGRGQGCWALSKKKNIWLSISSFFFFFLSPTSSPLSVAFSVSHTRLMKLPMIYNKCQWQAQQTAVLSLSEPSRAWGRQLCLSIKASLLSSTTTVSTKLTGSLSLQTQGHSCHGDGSVW